MPDIVDSATRSRMMSGIRGTNTKPELVVRQFLHVRGLRYRLHVDGLPGRPDIVLPKHRAVVFVHGCFWHRHKFCRFATTPSTNRQFWLDKLTGNVRRDRRHGTELSKQGWRVLIVWECDLSDRTLMSVVKRILMRSPATKK